MELRFGDYDDSEIAGKRKQLQARKRQFVADELRRLENDQPRDISKDASGFDTEIGYLRTLFLRICNLAKARGSLSKRLLLTAPIRSEVGRAVLSDLVALYKQKSEIESRPGLEPWRCCCVEEKRTSPRSVVSSCSSDNSLTFACGNSILRDPKRSRHVYGCVKKSLQATHTLLTNPVLCATCGTRTGFVR